MSNEKTDVNRRPSILIVDDVPKNLQVLGNILSEKKEYKIAAAVNGQQALGIINSAPPDIILLDVMMPEQDGFEICSKLKESDKTKEIPIIFLTAKTETEDIIKGFELGAADYVTKPFNKTELLVRVHNHLELKKTKDFQKELTADLREARKTIAESVRYSKIIQNTILPNPGEAKKCLPESFYIWMPKDIIASDIIIADSFGEIVIVGVMDCTGTSVSGAFMSIIAYSAMTEIIWKEKIHNPGEILKKLNFIIKESLHQDAEYAVSDDGLDAAVCAVNLKNKSVVFAGAKLPLFYTCNGKAEIIKGDEQGIGYRNSDPECDFTNHEIPVENEMSFYLSTDGFWKQPGGPEGSPMGINIFYNLIRQYSSEPFARHKELLISAFDFYKGKHERDDDVALAGFRLENIVS
ncbi:MAG: response regulator [Desulfobacterales bacterium]|nr:response regulator [Desulfobacterales bacterium]